MEDRNAEPYDRSLIDLVAESGLFDALWYVNQYPDVFGGWASPLEHYLSVGWVRGADPSPAFSTTAYLETYPDVLEAGANPLVHYLRHGKSEGRMIFPSRCAGTYPRIATDSAHEERRSLRRARPVFVFQMAKVGSRSVEAAVRKAFSSERVDADIYHVHTLERIEARRHEALRRYADPTDALRSLEKSEKVKAQLEVHRDRGVDVVTLVREPVGRAVSAFFHRLAWHVPDWEERYRRGERADSELLQAFLEAESPWESDWFKEELLPVFGVDVYDCPFPTQRGFATYQCGEVRVLLLRTEDLDRVGPAALSSFFEVAVDEIPRINTSNERSHAILYRDFRAAGLPYDFVRRCYDTEMARHFYTDDELDSFSRGWVAESSG